ncbi:hypothetical protein OPV22_007034 [Ensete ventricosum]|uniref:Uncharacterized protein n=1 Tax=Ensete ventricosum TaxID=4639 RepID=A0AAV8RK90_ENSVE|nr:hypothetical protein OPV22_007034 [Ensete ventricosum]
MDPKACVLDTPRCYPPLRRCCPTRHRPLWCGRWRTTSSPASSRSASCALTALQIAAVIVAQLLFLESTHPAAPSPPAWPSTTPCSTSALRSPPSASTRLPPWDLSS